VAFVLKTVESLMPTQQLGTMKWTLTVSELIEWLDGPPVEGDFDGGITGIADLRTAEPGQLSFLSGTRYAKHLAGTKASVVIVPEDQPGAPSAGQVWIRAANPSLALAAVCERLEKQLLGAPRPGIHPSALVDAAAEVDSSASIGPYCIIEAGARVGAEAVLVSHVRVERAAVVGDGTVLHHGVCVGWGCRIGRGCRLFAGAVIGADGFGFHSDKQGHRRLAQIGNVIIEDDVEIGANTTIDRARFAATRIGQGTRIDNLVQVGHNVTVGRHCILCAEVGIAGSAEIGDFVVMAGQVGVSGHIRVGDGVTATGQSGITKDIPPGTVLSGTPARPHREEMRRQALLNRLPDVFDRLKALEDGRRAD
jgi:UDP-3-O-[3-hydroxymyristoyl] glucosamine N-acyltransferase